MPPRKIAPFRDQPVGAGRGQPAERLDLFRGQSDAIPHPAAAVRIIGAPAAIHIEQLASDIGEIYLPIVLVFELDKAAAAASVAETFPLAGSELLKFLLPPKGEPGAKLGARAMFRPPPRVRFAGRSRLGIFGGFDSRRWRQYTTLTLTNHCDQS